MLSRNLLRQSRSFISSVPSSSTTPLASRAQRPLQTLLSSRLPAPARARIQTRWYSDATKAEAKESDESLGDSAPEGKEGSGKEAAKEEEDPMKQEIEKRNREIIDLKDRYLRSVADFRNLQERSRREQAAARDFAIQRFARDLIESVDNFDLALTNVPADKLVPPSESPSSAEASTPPDADPNKDLRQLHGGLRMTERVLMDTLKRHGLERFDPSVEGERFDPNRHEATFEAPQEGREDGTCFFTTQKGFVLNGRLLRAAKVGVVKNS